MKVEDVLKIFEKNKDFLLGEVYSKSNPVACILGGQPASGKGNLASIVTKNIYTGEQFLIVNGDTYRNFHPDYQNLVKNPHIYSRETQIFSNVFTEELIKEAIRNKFNIIIEGTMRNPQIPLNTSNLFKQNGFKVEALAISAPAIFTEIGIYIRYQEEVNKQKMGRLAEISSHNSAVEGVPKSLDLLYSKNAVDRIHIYSMYANEKVKSFSFDGKKWNCSLPPSNFIKTSREKQLLDKNLIQNLITKGKETFNSIRTDLKPNVAELLDKLNSISQKIDNSLKW